MLLYQLVCLFIVVCLKKRGIEAKERYGKLYYFSES